jgi:hypothetical protein
MLTIQFIGWEQCLLRLAMVTDLTKRQSGEANVPAAVAELLAQEQFDHRHQSFLSDLRSMLPDDLILLSFTYLVGQ